MAAEWDIRGYFYSGRDFVCGLKRVSGAVLVNKLFQVPDGIIFYVVPYKITEDFAV